MYLKGQCSLQIWNNKRLLKVLEKRSNVQVHLVICPIIGKNPILKEKWFEEYHFTRPANKSPQIYSSLDQGDHNVFSAAKKKEQL